MSHNALFRTWLSEISLMGFTYNLGGIKNREKYQDTPGSSSIYQKAPESSKFTKLPLYKKNTLYKVIIHSNVQALFIRIPFKHKLKVSLSLSLLSLLLLLLLPLGHHLILPSSDWGAGSSMSSIHCLLRWALRCIGVWWSSHKFTHFYRSVPDHHICKHHILLALATHQKTTLKSTCHMASNNSWCFIHGQTYTTRYLTYKHFLAHFIPSSLVSCMHVDNHPCLTLTEYGHVASISVSYKKIMS